MQRDAAERVMIALALASGVLLLLYALSAVGGTAGTDPLLWLFVAVFLVYLVWDVRRHLRAIASRSAPPENRNP